MAALNVNRWVGTQTDGNWYNASNWSLGRVPNSTDVATVEINQTTLNISFLRNGSNENPNVGGISLKATGGGNLTLNGLSQYTISSQEDTKIEALDGSQINLPTLQTINGSANAFTLNVIAKNRSIINLDNLTRINGGTTDFLSEGLGSVIRLSQLTNFTDTGFDRSLIKVVNTGVIELENIQELTEVDLVSDNSFLALPRLATYKGDNGIEAINAGIVKVDGINAVQGRILQVRATGNNSRVLISQDLELNVDYLAEQRNGGQVLVEGSGTVNYPPLVNQSIPRQNATEDQAFNFAFANNTFVEIDATNGLTYSATLTNGNALPSWLSFAPNTRTFSGRPTNSEVGTVNIRVRATDAAGASTTTDFALVVANVNDSPTVAQPIPDQQASSDQAFNFTFAGNTFNDVDAGDALTYSATLANGQALPTWLNFNAGNRTLSGTPPRTAIGTISIAIRATDRGGLFVSDTFNLVIADSNRAPIVANPLADQSATEDETFSFTIPANTFSDPNPADILTYTVNGLPSWLTFDAQNLTFTGTPANANVGTSNISVTARDPLGVTVSDTFSLNIINVNDAPTLSGAGFAPGNLLEDVPYSFTIANHFVDVDAGDTLTYSVTNLPSWLNFDPNTLNFSGTPGNEDVGNYSLVVRATDREGASVEDTLNLAVSNVNDAPQVINSLTDQTNTANLGYTYQIPSNIFEDIDAGDSLSYQVTLANGTPLPAWLLFDPATRTLSGIPTNQDLAQLDLQVTATDQANASVIESFSLGIYDTFNPIQYEASYPDLIRGFDFDPQGVTDHYNQFGRFEGRIPDRFDEYAYLAGYPDLLAGYGTNTEAVTIHFIEFGLDEGRSPNFFDTPRYVASYPDLIEAFGLDFLAGSRHYVEFGVAEGRRPDLFDPQAYLNNYPDLQAAFGNDLVAVTRHYIEFGFAEGRVWS